MFALVVSVLGGSTLVVFLTRHESLTTMAVGVVSAKVLEHSISISYCPHSGYTNQLYQLLTATQLSASLEELFGIRVKLFVPPLLLTKTVGPKCAEARKWCESCLERTPINESTSWTQVLDLHALGGTLLTLHDDYDTLLSTAAPTKGNASEADISRIFMCHLTRGCGVTLTLPEGNNDPCEKPFAAQENRTVGQQFPLACLADLLKRGDTGQTVTQLIFGSTYNLIPQVTKDLPIQHLVFNERVERATSALVANLFAGVSQEVTWCAHLRVGFSEWDTRPEPNFLPRWTQTISAFDKWIGGMEKVHGLVLTDNTKKVLQDGTMCPNDSAEKSNCVFEDHIDFSSPHLKGMSSPQRLAVLQRTCASASHLFLSTASSFSELIGVLHKDRSNKDVANLDEPSSTSRRSQTFSRARDDGDIFAHD